MNERVPQIGHVIEVLIAEGMLKMANLSGRIVDIGTFLGPGVLALDRYNPEASVGVDARKILGDGVSLETILGERFIQEDAGTYLHSLALSSVELITAFHSNIPMYNYFDQAKDALAPGGQLLVTTDMPNNVGYVLQDGLGIVPVDRRDWRELPRFNRPSTRSWWKGSWPREKDKFVYVYTKPDLHPQLA